jgi:hypothetical protein
VLGERLDLAELARSGFGLQSALDGRRQGGELDLLFYLYDGAGRIDENVFAVTVHSHLSFVVRLAIFFNLVKALDGCTLTLCDDGFFDRGRQVGTLDLLLVLLSSQWQSTQSGGNDSQG